MTVSGQTTQFIYDGDGNLVKKINPDGSWTIYVGGAMRIDGTLYYILKDHLGSASVVTNSAGADVGGQRYYPYGETRLSTGTIYTDKLFTGQREMEDLGIYHYNARFYSPKLGRFLSADTIVPGYANPQALNRYSYVLNNPLRYTDPTGHSWEDCGDRSGYRCKIHMKKVGQAKTRWAAEAAAQQLASTIKIGFGDSSCIGNPGAGCSFGLGTVVGDRQTIYTAFHVYDGASNKTLLYQTRDGRYHAMSGVTWDHAPGTDVMILYLSVALGSDFVPAKMNKAYVPSAGDGVRVAYKDDNSDYSGLHILPTLVRMKNTVQPGAASMWPFIVTGTSVYDPIDLTTNNPGKKVVNYGDSGGGYSIMVILLV